MREQAANKPATSRRLLRLSSAFTLAMLIGGFAASGSFALTHKHHHGRRHHGHVRVHHGISAHGQVIHRSAAHTQLIQPFSLNTNQSTNWSGYNQGTLEQGGKLFYSITGFWTVPKATQHVKGQDEFSADWIGIGGGCVDSGCLVTDATLIQTGTEQDVSANGTPSYSAWYELIPAPSLTITSLKVHAGDRMFASISEPVHYSNVWTIVLKDITDGQSFSTTVPYSSSHDTAEWIEETPLIIGTNGGFAALPNLTSPQFDRATTNGAAANLKSSEMIQLVDSNGTVIADPSAPDPDTDGFNICAWAGTCAAPTTS
jgi:peptidase A4-like protein